MEKIIIKGAREHNLKDIDLEIPRDKLVVITGVSGSGKSSLAFDTIYAEGQRRYVESLSAYARQFLEQIDKPDVESIEGLSPSISIEQKTTSKNPRSTVGTVTEIYDYLRLLFARVGRPHCYICGKPITSQTIQQMVDRVTGLPAGSRVMVLSPIVRGRKGEYRKELEGLRKDGYTKVKIDGEMHDLEEAVMLDKRKKHSIDVVVDRIILKEGVLARLADSLEAALRLAGGIAKVEVVGSEELLFNEKLSCVDCGISDPELVVPDARLSLREGAVAPWKASWGRRCSPYYLHMLEALAVHYAFALETPWKKLPARVHDVVLNGSGEEEMEFYYEKGKTKYSYTEPFEGVLRNLERRYRETGSDDVRTELEEYMNSQPCPECRGSRLKKEALFIKIGEKSVWDIVRMSIKDAVKFFKGLVLTETEGEIARRVLKEVSERLGFLSNVGLDYITLERPSATLSGGEGQRIR